MAIPIEPMAGEAAANCALTTMIFFRLFSCTCQAKFVVVDDGYKDDDNDAHDDEAGGYDDMRTTEHCPVHEDDFHDDEADDHDDYALKPTCCMIQYIRKTRQCKSIGHRL
jgi:hypothetical protein